VAAGEPEYLEVKLSGRDAPDRIAATGGVPLREELARFLNRQGPYALTWMRLASGEYVRYEHVVSIRIAD